MGQCYQKYNNDRYNSRHKPKNLNNVSRFYSIANSPYYTDNPLLPQPIDENLRFRSAEYKVLHDYNARTSEEICVKRGDRVTILDQNDPDWWFVQGIRSSTQKGYIPSSFVAAMGSLEAEDWFIPRISRKESERLLLARNNKPGTYLIRASETAQGGLTLCLKDREERSDIIKHYHVHRNPINGDFYVSEKRQFATLRGLVEFYSVAPAGLACRLANPCPRPIPITADLARQTKNHWEIPQSSIRLMEKLGSGQFGEVWQALWNESLEVAVKTLKTGSMTREEFLKEARIMKALNHPKLVRLYAVCMEEPIYIIFELMPGGSLLTHLRSFAGLPLDYAFLKRLVNFMSQIASGMAYLEREHFVHRDLAARNILVGNENDVKIADFGLTRMVNETYNDVYQAPSDTKMPIKWTAPEAIRNKMFNSKSDAWSYGIVLYEIITLGQAPYPSMTNNEAHAKVLEGYRMPKPPQCPLEIYKKMLECWDAVADRRPNFQNLFDYFDNYEESLPLI